MVFMELHKLTIKQASERLQKTQDISSVELTESCLGQIEELNPKLNAVLSVLKDEAMRAAEESDKQYAISHKRRSPLDGVPIVVKDNMMIKGTITTAGSKILENFKATYDATVVSKLEKAGAVIIGKTNMDEFAMGSSTENSAFGPTKNPHDIERVPGGSSGGSAAAVAADMCMAALGSDTGGSIRQPASLCGVVGFKPTYGVVSRYGLLAMASSLDQIGPITKSVEDTEILYNIIKGYDPKDSTSKSNYDIKNNAAALRIEDRKLKIGIPKEYFGEGLDGGVRKVIEEAIEKLKKIGAEVKEISLPNQKYALATYYIIMPVEVASNLARYDGIKYGYSEIRNPKSETRNLIEVYTKTRSVAFGKEAKRRIMLGTYTSSAGYVDQYYNKAQKVRALIKKDFDEAFKQVDFIVGPVSPTVAFKFGEKTDNPLTMYLSDIYTIAVNLAGLPAISVPAGFSGSNPKKPIPGMGSNRLGLPVGLHIIGPQFSDHQILNLAKKLEGARNGLQGERVS